MGRPTDERVDGRAEEHGSVDSRWADGQTDGQMGGWLDRLMSGGRDRQMDRWVGKQTEGWTDKDERRDRHEDGQMGRRQPDRWTDRLCRTNLDLVATGNANIAKTVSREDREAVCRARRASRIDANELGRRGICVCACTGARAHARACAMLAWMCACVIGSRNFETERHVDGLAISTNRHSIRPHD